MAGMFCIWFFVCIFSMVQFKLYGSFIAGCNSGNSINNMPDDFIKILATENRMEIFG